MLCRGSSAGCVEGGAVGGRGRVVGGPVVRGRGDVYSMLPCRSRVVLWWLKLRVGGEGGYGDGVALMRGVEVVVVTARVLGHNNVWCWYVPFFGRVVVGHEDVDSPRIVGREVEVRYGWNDGASPEVCECRIVACRRFFDDGLCPLWWGPNLLGHGGDGVGNCCEVRADARLVCWWIEAPFWCRGLSP